MTTPRYVRLAVEGPMDEEVLKRLLSRTAPDVDLLAVHGKQGKDHLRENIHRYAAAAQHGPWIVLADLNHEAKCAPHLVSKWLPRRPSGLLLRVAVRAVEAWLMADRLAFARFLGVPPSRLPVNPDTVEQPKHFLVGLARRSGDARVRLDLVPAEGSTARVGPGYSARVTLFIHSSWDPRRAAQRSPSLRRAVRSLKRFTKEIPPR